LSKSARLTVSLPTDLLDELERYLRQRGETRSSAVARLLQTALREESERADRDEQERRDIERYIRGYLEQPETEEELRESEAMLKVTVWDPWP